MKTRECGRLEKSHTADGKLAFSLRVSCNGKHDFTTVFGSFLACFLLFLYLTRRLCLCTRGFSQKTSA